MSPELFVLYLHQNYVDFFEDIDDLVSGVLHSVRLHHPLLYLCCAHAPSIIVHVLVFLPSLYMCSCSFHQYTCARVPSIIVHVPMFLPSIYMCSCSFHHCTCAHAPSIIVHVPMFLPSSTSVPYQHLTCTALAHLCCIVGYCCAPTFV